MTDTLPCGVMVARRILVPPVRVRILPRQQSKLQLADNQPTAIFFCQIRTTESVRCRVSGFSVMVVCKPDRESFVQQLVG